MWKLAAAVLCLGTVSAMADDLPKGLGHPTGDHWYDRSCCDNRDCEPVEAGAIQRWPGGYFVKYRTSRGHVASGFLERRSTGVKPSQDGMEHACAPSSSVVCIYLPAES